MPTRWMTSPWSPYTVLIDKVSGDLLGLLLLNADPQRRGLDAQEGLGGARYWTFPQDFDQRTVRLFSPAVPAAPAPGPR